MTQIHRSKLVLLSATVLAAACAREDASPMNDALDKDAVLEARLRSSSIATSDVRGSSTTATAACRPVSQRAATATAAQQARADLQLQFAKEAEIARDARGVRDALRRAAELDPTNEGIAYRLARASEGLHDVSAAVAEYCRYLALAPDAADSAVASERLRTLSAYAAAGQGMPSRPTAAPRRVARAASARSSSQPVVGRNQTVAVASNGSVAAGAAETRATAQAAVPAAAAEPAERPGVVSAPAAAASEASERVSARQPEPEAVTPEQGAAEQGASDQATPQQRTPERPTPRPQPATERINTRSVVTGAAVGAVLGTIVGRDVKSAVIGAAAGGVLGGIAGGRPWGGGQTYAARRSGGWR